MADIDLHWHDLRHEAAFWWLAKGIQELIDRDRSRAEQTVKRIGWQPTIEKLVEGTGFELATFGL